MASLLIFVATLAVVGSAERQYFVLRHEELSSLSIDVENGDSPAAGKALAIRRHVSGLPWYEDTVSGAVRTADGDLCVSADQDGVLRLAVCGGNDWRFYQDPKAYVSGLVEAGNEMHIAVWENSEDIYTPGANVKLVSKPFDEFKNNYGAEWIQKSTSVRDVNLRRLKSLLRRTVNAVVAARADSKQFYLGHKEFTLTVVSVEGGRQVQAGNALLAHYSQDLAANEALMFTEDPQTKNIVTVRGRLCVTNGNGTPKVLKLAQCESGGSHYRLRRLTNGRVSGIVLGTDESSMTIAAFGHKSAVMNRQDDQLVALPYTTNKYKFSTKFGPKY